MAIKLAKDSEEKKSKTEYDDDYLLNSFILDDNQTSTQKDPTEVDEFCNELNNMQNWQLHENYSYLSFERLVRRTKYMMIGFDWCKHDYGKEVLVDPHAKVVNKVVDRLMEGSIDNQ